MKNNNINNFKQSAHNTLNIAGGGGGGSQNKSKEKQMMSLSFLQVPVLVSYFFNFVVVVVFGGFVLCGIFCCKMAWQFSCTLIPSMIHSGSASCLKGTLRKYSLCVAMHYMLYL